MREQRAWPVTRAPPWAGPPDRPRARARASASNSRAPCQRCPASQAEMATLCVTRQGGRAIARVPWKSAKARRHRDAFAQALIAALYLASVLGGDRRPRHHGMALVLPLRCADDDAARAMLMGPAMPSQSQRCLLPCGPPRPRPYRRPWCVCVSPGGRIKRTPSNVRPEGGDPKADITRQAGVFDVKRRAGIS